MTSPVGITFPEGMSILVNPDKEVFSGCYVIARKNLPMKQHSKNIFLKWERRF